MIKKILFAIFLLLIFLVYYFYNQPKTQKDEKSTYNEIQTHSTTVVFKDKTASPDKTSKTKIIKTADKNFEEYEQNEQEWLGKVEDLLGEKDFQFYVSLREKNDQEKMQAYQEFHDYLRKKHGDNFSYNISEDQSIREKDINTRYTRLLLKQIGEEKFKNYLKIRDHFNEELQRKSPNGQALVIEF